MWVMDWNTTPVVPTAFRSRLGASAGTLGDAVLMGRLILRLPGTHVRRWNPPLARVAGAILGSAGAG
jgi:hypothetical protein